jgi:hypothetical protein
VVMYSAAPRIERRFLKGVAKLDDRSEPIAETYRRTRDLAAQMGVPRPSYERVRLHLHAARRREEERRRTRELILQLAYNTRPANEVVPELLRLVD